MAIDPLAGFMSLVVLVAVYQYLKRTAGPDALGGYRRSFYLQQIRQNLIAADKEPEHPRNWRPQILAFSDDTHRRERLFAFCILARGRKRSDDCCQNIGRRRGNHAETAGRCRIGASFKY